MKEKKKRGNEAVSRNADMIGEGECLFFKAWVGKKVKVRDISYRC